MPTVGAAESPAALTDGARINSSHPLLSPRDTLFYKKRLGGLWLLLKIALLRGEGFDLKSFDEEALKGKEMLLQPFI